MALKFIQKGFSGGMNRRVDATRIGQNQYPLGINVRNRFDTLVPVLEPLSVTLPAQGAIQGLYTAGSFMLLFISGLAYIKNFNFPNSVFQQIAGLQLDATAERVYAALVPASVTNFQRAGSISTVTLGAGIASSPRCVVVQDGTSQPWLINGEGIARKANDYSQWTTSNREWVPIGRQMLYYGDILYIAGPSGELYRSIAGRPLDFVVNVDGGGNKPAEWTQANLPHRVGFDELTCLAALQSPDGGFFAGSATFSKRVVPDWENTLFGQPQFDNIDLFPTGPLNHFCAGDILGDFAFVDFGGITSFNSVQQVQNEGRNAPFHQDIYPLFEGVIQEVPCFGKFDNYALFGVKTIHGNGIAVYDELARCWASLDIYDGVGAIQQFAEIKTPAYRRLFFITDTNELYEAFAGDDVAGPRVFLGDWTSGDPATSQKPLYLRTVFINAREDGEATIVPYVDRKAVEDASITLEISESADTLDSPLTLPFGPATQKSVNSQRKRISHSLQGWQCGLWASWNCNAGLSHVSVESEDDGDNKQDKANQHAEARA